MRPKCSARGASRECEAEAKLRRYVRVANPGSGARNPGFDVTPPELITGIITPAGHLQAARTLGQPARLGFSGR